MMGWHGMMGGGEMMWGMGLFGVLVLALLVLVIAALIKYLRNQTDVRQDSTFDASDGASYRPVIA
jgi:uncharacterized membrane protein